MHTDIAKMKYDNGQNIIHGVSTEGFEGIIYSGHIHFCYEDTLANLFNLGSACAFTFNDVNMDKYVYIYVIVGIIVVLDYALYKLFYKKGKD